MGISLHRAGARIAWVALVTCGLLASASAQGPADVGAYRGRIIASDVAIAAPDGSFDSVGELVSALSRIERAETIAACCDGAWRVHFAAVLDRPAGEEVLFLEFQEKDGAPHNQVFTTEVPVKPEQTYLVLNDFVISSDLGFVAGHKYTVTIARSRGSDRDILARGTFMLLK